MLNILPRIKNKILKNLQTWPLLKKYHEIAYQTAIQEYIPYLPNISASDFQLVQEIKSQGVAITSLEKLGFLSTSPFIQSAHNLLPEIKSSLHVQKHGFVVHANAEQMLEYPEIFLWGLEKRLLNIIENYLGLSAAYHGAYFRRDIANQLETGSRLWHIDTEDRQVIKIIIYINDVDEQTGPFQYLPKSLTLEAVKSLKYTSGYITDQTMQKVISPHQYHSCLGSAGTVIFAATSSIFHRGKPPKLSDRFAIFFDYTARFNKFSYYQTSPLTHQFLLQYFPHLSEQQKKYIYWR